MVDRLLRVLETSSDIHAPRLALAALHAKPAMVAARKRARLELPSRECTAAPSGWVERLSLHWSEAPLILCAIR